MWWIWIALMIVSAAGMLFGQKKYKAKGVAWGRPLAGACGVLTVAFAIMSMTWHFIGPKWKTQSLMEREARYQQIKLEYLAKHLTEKYSGQSFAVVYNPQLMAEGQEDDMREAFGALNVVNWEAIQTEIPPEMMEGVEGGEIPMDMALAPGELTAEAFNKIINDNANVDVIISVAGLPMDTDPVLLWSWNKKANKPEREVFAAEHGKEPPALVLVGEGYTYGLKRFFRPGYILASVQAVPAQGIDQDSDIPTDLEEAFNKRFIMITPENVDALDKQYEDLFMDPEPEKK